MQETRPAGMTGIFSRILNQIMHEPTAQIGEIIEKGSVNRVFRVNTEHGDRILRLREDPSAHQEYHKEKWCLLDGNPSAAAFEAFLSGYGIDSEAFQSMKADIHHIMLLDAFDKLRWAIDRSPSDVSFTKVARQVLALQQAGLP